MDKQQAMYAAKSEEDVRSISPRKSPIASTHRLLSLVLANSDEKSQTFVYQTKKHVAYIVFFVVIN